MPFVQKPHGRDQSTVLFFALSFQVVRSSEIVVMIVALVTYRYTPRKGSPLRYVDVIFGK